MYVNSQEIKNDWSPKNIILSTQHTSLFIETSLLKLLTLHSLDKIQDLPLTTTYL